MGKDSLLKSTSKKKGKGKKAEDKDKRAQNAAKKKNAKKKSTEKKKAAKKKAAKKKTAKKKTAPKKKSSSKKSPSTKKKLTAKELIFMKFTGWEPKKPAKVAPDKDMLKGYSAPPFISGRSEEETKRIKELLFLKFDMDHTIAAAEKGAAEKEAVEKAVAENAAAEKEAAEKAAAEKAAAEKDVAEKAAQEKYEEKQQPDGKGIMPPSPPLDSGPDPMKSALFIVIGILFLLMIPIIVLSISNADRYYLKPKHGALEIWKGDFAPVGKKRMIILHGVQFPEGFSSKKVYTEEEAFQFAFNYHVDKASALQSVKGMPDYDEIKAELKRAYRFAATKEHRKILHKRQTAIDLAILKSKAEIAASSGTIEGTKEALRCLKEAEALDIEEADALIIKRKISVIEKRAKKVD